MAKRTRNIYDPQSPKPFKISRSTIDLFIECPSCFYLDRRLGIARPPGFPFNLNSAVDALLKKEFDLYRKLKKPHPLMSQYGIESVPFEHPDLDKWRENFVGLQFLHTPTNLLITGALDDLWINTKGQLNVVDYKSTSKNTDITALDEPWHAGYKRQLEVYQWLLKQTGFEVSPTCYWVYANGDKSLDRFDACLKFKMTIIAYQGKTSWVEGAVQSLKNCLNGPQAPQSSPSCSYCTYVTDLGTVDS